jgi:formate dehydrogenase subunit gamma
VAVCEPWSAERGAAIIAPFAAREGGLMPALRALQETFGYIPEPAVRLLAQALNLTRAEVHGVASFYHEFRRHPPARHVLRLCRAEACQSMGGERIAAQIRDRLGLDWHATTADGSVMLEPVFCLGLCAVAPSAMLDGRPIGRIDAARVVAYLTSQPNPEPLPEARDAAARAKLPLTLGEGRGGGQAL